MSEKKATKGEMALGCLLGFLISFFLAAYYYDFWFRLFG